MKKIILLSFVLYTISTNAIAQNNVGIGTNTPNPNAKLDISSTTKGLLIPRMTSVQRIALSGTLGLSDEGMMVYDTDLQKFFYWDKNIGFSGNWNQVRPGSLSDGKIWVGDASNTAVEQTMSGDVLLSNTGVATIQPNAVQGTDISLAGENTNNIMQYNGTDWVPVDPSTITVSNIYTANGSLTGNRTVTQGSNSLAFTSTATNGFSVDGSTFSVDAANDRVGIGNPAPLAKLHVSTNTIPAIALQSSSNIGTWLSIGNTDPAGKWFDIISTATSNGEGAGKLIFTRAAGPTLTAGTILTMDWATSNVGIGTTAPTNKLEVVGNTKTTNFQMTSGATNNYVLKSDASGNGAWVDPSTLTVSNIYTANGSLTGNRTVTQGANTLTFSSTATNGFSVDDSTFSVDAANNRIGIGNPLPAAKLDVLGQNGWDVVNFPGDFRIGNGTYDFRFGVALGGAGAGDAFINSRFGTQRVNIGGGTNNFLLTVDGLNNRVGVGVPGNLTSATKLDVNGDIAYREGTALALANGANGTITPGATSNIRITGPTAAFSIAGISGGVNGKIITIVNTTAQSMTLLNNSAVTATDGFFNPGSAPIILDAQYGAVNLQYNTTLARWVVQSYSKKDGSTWLLTGNTGTNDPNTPVTYGTSTIASNENWIGTTDANDVVVGTNNIERFRVKQTTGNVGIGTATPTQKLTVNGNIDFPNYNNAIIGFPTAVAGNHGLLTLQAGSNVFSGTAFTGGNIAINAGNMNVSGATAASSGNVVISAGINTFDGSGGGEISFRTGLSTTSPTERMRIKSNGNVGIGNTNPTSSLYVGNGAIGGGVLPGINVSVGAGSYVTASSGTITSFIGADGSGYAIAGSLTNHDYVIRSNNTERIRVLATGNVGIGATAPAVKLAVDGNGTNVYNTSIWSENNIHAQGNETMLVGGRGRLRLGSAWNYAGIYAEQSSTGANNDLVLGASSALVRVGPGTGQNLFVSGRTYSLNTSNVYERTTNAGGIWGGESFWAASVIGGVHIYNSESEQGGFYADGNYAAIYNPGDNDLLKIMDEDYFNNTGDIFDNGSVRARVDAAGAYFQISDKNLKINILPIQNALTKINQISGYTYEFSRNEKEIEKGQKPIPSAGVIAQEVEKILPEAVSNQDGHYMVNYAAITPLLIQAIKEQQQMIEELKKRVQQLESNK